MDFLWVVRIMVVLYFVWAVNLQDHRAKELFSELHQIIVIFVGPVEFTSRELRIVCEVDSFISELLTNFEYSV
jgi:hypothetical protein